MSRFNLFNEVDSSSSWIVMDFFQNCSVLKVYIFNTLCIANGSFPTFFEVGWQFFMLPNCSIVYYVSDIGNWSVWNPNWVLVNAHYISVELFLSQTMLSTWIAMIKFNIYPRSHTDHFLTSETHRTFEQIGWQTCCLTEFQKIPNK